MEEMLRRAALFDGVDEDDVHALAGQFEILDAPRSTVLFTRVIRVTACMWCWPAR